MDRLRFLFLGIILITIVIAVFSVVFFVIPNSSPKSVFEVMPIAMPQWEVGLEKPAAYIDVSLKNTGRANETDVSARLSGGFSNSSNEVPDKLVWILTKTFDVIGPGETVTIPKIFSFGWYFFYQIEVTSSDGTKETFNQWVPWRSWDLPLPSG